MAIRPTCSTEELVAHIKSTQPAAHLLRINNFSLIKKYQIKTVESSVFDIGGHKLKIILYPNGYNNVHRHVFISLENQDSEFNYLLFAVNQKFRIWHNSGRRTATPSSKNEIMPLMSHFELERNGYLVQDSCLFAVKLYEKPPTKLVAPNSGTAECFSLIEKPDNHTVTWMMTKFSSFKPEKVHNSDEFVTGNRKWRIEVQVKEKEQSFSMYLKGEGLNENAPKAKCFVKVALRVIDQTRRNHIVKTVSDLFDTGLLGFPNFMPLEKLCEPYLVKNKLYVGVDFEVISVTSFC